VQWLDDALALQLELICKPTTTTTPRCARTATFVAVVYPPHATPQPSRFPLLNQGPVKASFSTQVPDLAVLIHKYIRGATLSTIQ